MHMFRTMIYTIVKLKLEHKKIIIHINMGVSQILHMYITSLITIVFKHNEHEKLKHTKINH